MTASPVTAAILLVAIIATSLAVVYSRHQDRKLFIELQALGYDKDAMDVEYGQLQLEQSTLTTHGQVEQAAHERLGMLIPRPDNVVIVRP